MDCLAAKEHAFDKLNSLDAPGNSRIILNKSRASDHEAPTQCTYLNERPAREVA